MSSGDARYNLLLREPNGWEYRSGPWTAALIREVTEYYQRRQPQVDIEVSDAEAPPDGVWGPMWST